MSFPARGPSSQGPRRSERRYDAIFFDMGYTLVYFEPRQAIIAQQALLEAGAQRSVDEIKAAVEAVYADYYRDAATATFPPTPEHDRETQVRLEGGMLRRLGLDADPGTLQVYTDAIEAAFSQRGVMRPYPEVVEILAALRAQSYRLGIVSNWSWNLRKRVAQVELDPFFEVVWASAYAGCNKPHPDIFRQALAQMPSPALSPDRVLHAGDSYWHDVLGARAASLDAVLVDRNGTANTPDCPVISDLRGLFDLLG